MSSVKLQGNASGAGSVTLASPNTSNNITLTLPTTVGSSNQVMTTDGSGNLSFAATGVRNGGTATSSAVDITLTASSNQVQQVTMTATGKYVILPDATTMTKGAEFFVIENKGAYSFGIKDSAGNILLDPVYYFQQATVTLRDNSTAAGTWGIGTTTAIFATQGPSTLSVLTAVSNSTLKVVPLSSTTALIVYLSAFSPSTYNAVVATISGTTVTYGSAVTIISSASYQNSVLYSVALSSTSAAVFLQLTTGAMQGFALSISGTTITVGTAATSGVTGLSYMAFFQNSSTVGVTAYYSGTTVTARAFSVSGTTFTWGTAVTLFTSGGTAVSSAALAPISANTYVVAISNDVPQNQHRAFSISGTTITNGAATTTDSTNTNAIASGRGYNISSGTSYFGYGATPTSYYSLTYSGTTFSSVSTGANNTAGTVFGFSVPSGAATFGGGGKSGWGTSTNLYYDGAYIDLSAGVATSYYLPSTTNFTDGAVLDTTNVLVVYRVSNTLGARVIKFVG